MFGLVMVNAKELTEEEQARYMAHYCGLCRKIGKTCGQGCRMALRYDLAFLSLLLISLYEPEEQTDKISCALHPIRGRQAADSEIMTYAALMNVALAYDSCLDHWKDDKSLPGLAKAKVLGRRLPQIREAYPRQCEAVTRCIRELSALEDAGCKNPDDPANCFGELMAELFVYREDLWQRDLRALGLALGRFIYLADAAADYRRDKMRGNYNPWLACGVEDVQSWERILVLEMDACAKSYERLPLVQDKSLMDKILYSGIWMAYRKKMGKKREDTDE